jgi:hypothetical protein
MLQRLVAVGVLSFASAAGPASADDWHLLHTEHGTEISRRSDAGGNVAMKGVGTVDAALWKIASILLDTARAPEWVDSLKESRVVQHLGPTEYVEYNHIGMPLVIKDREFVSDVRIEVDPVARARSR